MTQFIAISCLVALSVLCTLGNFWFTYGVWPRSWLAFVLFSLIGLLLMLMMQAVTKGDE